MTLVATYIDDISRNLNIDNELSPSSLYDPIKYLIDIGGKRLRPACALMGAHLFDDSYLKALPAAKAVEFFHNFSLMHDDIMDQAELRRGFKTVHLAYDTNAAILSGDMMLIMAYEELQHIPEALLPKAFAMFNKVAREVCEGQRWDMDFERMKEVSVTQYIHMITLKTSVLLAASLQLGALCGGASDQDQNHLYEYGKNIGIAFQIQDDILDLYGDAKVGKTTGGDIIQNKKTYLYLKALELSTPQQRQQLLTLYNNENTLQDGEKINIVRGIFDSLVVREYANQLMEAYKDLAISHLKQIGVPESRKKACYEMADYLIQRSH